MWHIFLFCPPFHFSLLPSIPLSSYPFPPSPSPSQAKKAREQAALRNAQSLFDELDAEKEKRENKKKAAAKKRSKRKEKKRKEQAEKMEVMVSKSRQFSLTVCLFMFSPEMDSIRYLRDYWGEPERAPH